MSKPRYQRSASEAVIWQREHCDDPAGFVLHLPDGFHAFAFDGTAYRDLGLYYARAEAERALHDAEGLD